MSYSMQQDVAHTFGVRRSSPVRSLPLTQRNKIFLAAGAALAASALLVRQQTRKVEREHPPGGGFIDVAGVRLHYIERGQGQPLVLLHGNGSMIQDWESSGLIDMAARKHRVIAFDRPGYGYSERPRGTTWTPQAQADLLHRALLYLGVERPLVVGHSWGTLVALSLALDYPDYVKSLVLLSGYYYPTVRADVPVLSLPALPVIGDLMRYTVSPLFGRMIWPAILRRIFGPAPVPERFAAEFPLWMALRPSQLRASAAESAQMIPAAFSMRKRYHELTMPIVLMSGDSDRHVDMHAQSERLYQDIPQSVLHVTRGAGHMLHHFAPQQVMEAIEQTEQETTTPQQARAYPFPTSARLN